MTLIDKECVNLITALNKLEQDKVLLSQNLERYKERILSSKNMINELNKEQQVLIKNLHDKGFQYLQHKVEFVQPVQLEQENSQVKQVDSVEQVGQEQVGQKQVEQVEQVEQVVEQVEQEDSQVNISLLLQKLMSENNL